MVNYVTYPIIQEAEGVDYQLHQNLSDLVYAVFYSDSSPLVTEFRKGSTGEIISSACAAAIVSAIGKLEEQDMYVIETVNLVSLADTDDILEVVLEVVGQAGTITKTITLDKATI